MKATLHSYRLVLSSENTFTIYLECESVLDVVTKIGLLRDYLQQHLLDSTLLTGPITNIDQAMFTDVVPANNTSTVEYNSLLLRY